MFVDNEPGRATPQKISVRNNRRRQMLAFMLLIKTT